MSKQQNRMVKEAWIYCGVVLLVFVLFIPVLTREVKERTLKSAPRTQANETVLTTEGEMGNEEAPENAAFSGTDPDALLESAQASAGAQVGEGFPATAPEARTPVVADKQAGQSSDLPQGNSATEGETADKGENPDGSREDAVADHRPLAEVNIAEIIWPLEGEIIREVGLSYAQTFSDYRYHSGIDIKADRGAQAKATLPGRISRKETTKDDGMVITIEHGQQDGVVWYSVYAHLGETTLKEGDEVAAGDVVGLIGQPGYNEITEGPHLHYSLYQDNQVVNPLDYLP